MKIREYCAIVLAAAALCITHARAEESIELTNSSNDFNVGLNLYTQGNESPQSFQIGMHQSQMVSVRKPLAWVQVESSGVSPKWSSKGFAAGKTVKAIDYKPGRITIYYTDGTVDRQPPITAEAEEVQSRRRS